MFNLRYFRWSKSVQLAILIYKNNDKNQIVNFDKLFTIFLTIIHKIIILFTIY